MLPRGYMTWSRQISRARTSTQSRKCLYSRDSFHFVLQSKAKEKWEFLSDLMRLRIFPDIFGIPLTDIILRQHSAISADFSSRRRQLFWKGFPMCLCSVAYVPPSNWTQISGSAVYNISNKSL